MDVSARVHPIARLDADSRVLAGELLKSYLRRVLVGGVWLLSGIFVGVIDPHESHFESSLLVG